MRRARSGLGRAIDLMKPLGDRRARMRFEIVGSLRGNLDVGEAADLVNISRDGALLASRLALAVGSVQTLHLTLSRQEIRVDARVRHLRQIPTDAGWPTYLIGMEFLSLPPWIVSAIQSSVEEASQASLSTDLPELE